MPEIKHLFNAGRMNKDLDERLIPNGEYRDALNIQLASTDGNDAGAIQNIIGNSQIASGLTFSNPFFKGYAVDFSTEKIYWLLKEDTASYLFSYDGTSVVTLIKDVGNLVFKFDSENLITGINFFEGFLAFTDNLNEPKIIDLRLFEAGTDKISAETGANGRTQINGVDLQEKDITVIKEKPLNAPKIGFTVNAEFETDPVIFEDKFVRFAYRWKFKNGQYSPLSPFSITAFVPKEEIEYDLEEGFNVQMLNNVTSIDLVDIETKEDVEYIDILYKESNNNNVYVYKTIPATDLSDPDSVVTITKESVYSVIPSDQILRHYDNVPKKALAQDVIGNRIVYGNYTDGIDLSGYEPNFSVGLQDRIAVDLDNISISVGQRYRSIKAGRNYQIGILFEDKYGRQTPVLSNDTGSIYRDFTGIGFGKELTVSTSAAPISSDITRFKYYIKSTEQEYYNIVVDEAYNDTDEPETFLWLVIPSYEINKVEEQDFIILKKGSNSDVALNNPALKYKVLDIQNSKPDNISSSKAFNDKFFVKLKKDVYLTEELFAQQGLGGASGIISDGDEEWIVGTGGMSSGALSLYYFDYFGTRTTYYYQDGKIYEGESQVNEDSQANNAPTGTTVNPSCGDGMDDWFVIGSSVFGFVDSLGNTIAAIYVRKIEGGTTVPAAQDFLICYENSNTNVPDPSPAIFETIPKNDILDIYYETEESYPISEIAETKRLQWYNCLDLTNGVESNRIRDDFNEVTIDKQVRVSTTISEQFKERENTSGLIWSGLFNSRNSVNRLNQFSTGEAITKDLNPEYGTIQKLHSRDTDLIALCEDKILRILANKDALYNADGSTNITASNNVLGQAMPYNGEFGISKNPESFASYGYQAYFTDKARGAVLRLSKDGLTLLSSKNMNSYFRDKLKGHSGFIIGSYDVHTRQYILSFKNDESLAFSEAVDGWTTRLNFVPESGLYLNGDYFTFNSSQLWKHHSSGINNFYGSQYDSSVKFIFNDEPSVVKNFKTLAYEGTQGKNLNTDGWQATSIETDLQSGKVTYFKGKEGKWFNNIEGISNTLSNIDSKEFSVQGIGSASNVIIPFSCSNAGFTVSDGTVGDGIDANISSGSIVNITPSTYQLGTIEYTAEILAPFGYSNSGSTINCISTAIGIPTFTCADAAFTVAEGTEGETVQATSAASIVSISPSTYQVGLFVYTGTIVVPSGFSNSGSTINCTSTANGIALPEYTCTEASFSVSDGTEGDNVQATAAETIISITPSTYQLGTNIYTAVITIPSGYLNAGGTISCTDTATGSAVIEPDPTFDCSAASFNVSDGTVGNAVSATSSGTIVSISPSTYQLGTTTYVGTITAPAGYSNVGSNISCSDSAAGSNGGDPDPTFDCNTASFTVYDGQIGDPINAISSGTIVSISPSTYQTGTVTYTGTITAPAGYTNSGSNISCTDTASGSDTPVEDPTFTCNDANFSVSNGEVGDPVQATASGAIVSITPSTYQSGTTTYTGVITIPNGFQNPGSTISCTDTATGTETPVTFEYHLESCTDGLTSYKSDPTTAVFADGERVTTGFYTYVVLGTNPPAGATSVGWIVYTGFTGCPTVADPTYTCNDASFSVSDGVVGDPVQATSSSTIVSISPSTYQGGAITYTGVITIPAGYDNAGGTISCTDSALGTSAPTCHAVTYDESFYGLDTQRYGIAYNDYQGNLQKVAFGEMLASVSGTQYTYYVCATTVSNDVWDITNNVAVPQYNNSLSSTDSGTSCDGFCEPPGGGGL